MQNLIKIYTKRTKLHHLKKISRWGMPPNSPSKAHGFAMHSMSLRDMQIFKSEKKIVAPPPCQVLETPLQSITSFKSGEAYNYTS